MLLDLRVNGLTKLTGLIGNPVEHTISPILHNSIFSLTGCNGIYLPIKVPEGRLKDAVNGLRAAGFIGFNVTIPYKGAILEFLDEISEEAALLEAVNTVKIEGDRLLGTNTDGEGFLRAFLEETGTNFKGASVCVLGAGGTARTLAIKIALEGASKISIINRTESSAIELAERIYGIIRESSKAVTGGNILEAASISGCPNTASVDSTAGFEDHPALSASKAWSLKHIPAISASKAGSPEAIKALMQCDIIVNATSVGMHPNTDTCPVDDDFPFRRQQIIYDVIYSPAETKLMALARRKGCLAVNGAGMLFYQGVNAFETWMGTNIPEKELGNLSASFLKYLQG